MDDQRFDLLTRAFASGSSRRSLLKGLLGFGVTAGAVSTRMGDSSARQRGGSNNPPPPTPTPSPTETPPICDNHPCGLDCCESADQCCDGECCPAGYVCSGEETCVSCLPNCDGRDCGDDGCGGSCGTCPDGSGCLRNGTCAILCPGGLGDEAVAPCVESGCLESRCATPEVASVLVCYDESVPSGPPCAKLDDCPPGTACFLGDPGVCQQLCEAS